RADAPSGQVVAAPPTASAPLAIATPMLPPSDAQTAFVDGYRAYNDHDTGRAIDRLKFAADNFPALGDYALYYLALAEIGQGDLNSAVGSLRRLTQNYPQSVLFDQAELQLAQTLYKLASYQDASAVASGLIARSPDPSIERAARLTEAKALVALGNSSAAYTQAMELRDRFPHSDADPEARALAYGIIASNPEIAPTHSLEYHRSESELLLREGQLSEAAEQARAGLAMDPTPQVRAELLWLTARAHKPQPEQAKRDISQYLQLAPHGPAAPNALEMLALIYWHDDDYQHARATFSRLAANYPASTLAPAALLRIGRTYEDEHKIDAARSAYRRLIARYPHSDAAADARFRVPWTLYTTHSYASAARGFSEARVHAKESGDRDMCDYWRARALDKSGDVAAARELFARVAASTDSNYYPALASKRVAANPILPASYASEPEFNGIPNVGVGSEFHLQRLQTLRALGLKDLEAGELNALAQRSSSLEVRRFVLAGFANADAWYAAIVVATRMEKSGQVSHAIAERVRYPRAYWDIFQSASIRLALDPYLVLALSRQESLFNPQATSSSNARGLMQLIPSTAKKMAAERGIEIDSTRLYDPATNVDLGTTYLKNLLQMFGGDAFHAVAAYNAGEHAVAKWLAAFHGDDDEWVENIAYKETRDYVKKVIGGRREYLLLYQHGA
ncbi:MAG: Lytic transglycosylase, catalytic, partial [Candidatus Binatus sp.]|nr:Lytic transglycosylase, catalytic [Candidatus Binatus sp.]